MSDYEQPDRYKDITQEVIAEYGNEEDELKAKFTKFLETPKQQVKSYVTVAEALPKGSCMFAGDKPFLDCDGRYCQLDGSFCPHRICTNKAIYHDCIVRRTALAGADF